MEENKPQTQEEAQILDAMEEGAVALQETILDGQCVAVPISEYTELIRAETERDIYEACLMNDKYSADTIIAAIRGARDTRRAIEEATIVDKHAADTDEEVL